MIRMATNKLVLIGLLMAMLAVSGCIDSPGDAVKPITVGASGRSGHVADFSGSGPTGDGRTKPTLVAPGVDIISCRASGTDMGDPVDKYYTMASGTSMSTPYAAGAAALLLQANPDLTPAGVKAALTTTAVKLNNTEGLEYEEFYQGTGEIDVYQAYLAANNDSLAGIVPDQWIAGAWTYTGLEYGADRPTKKIYAVAPGWEDSVRFVFFTDRELSGVTISTNGTAGDWITVQPLLGSISANEQKAIDATLTVPDWLDSGTYTGNITMNGDGESVLSVPVTVNIAQSVEITNGTGTFDGSLGDNEWKYFYFDIPESTERAEVSLENYTDDVDLFLFTPTHECIDQDSYGQTDAEVLENPSAGRWMAIVYGKDVTSITSFSGTVDIYGITGTPSRWNPGILKPDETVSQSFSVTNDGIELSNIGLDTIMLNITRAHEFNNSLICYGNVSDYFDVPAGLDRFEVTVRWNNSNSHLYLGLYDPNGYSVDYSGGHSNIELVRAIRPIPGRWRVEVGGYVPPYLESQAFEGVVEFYRRESCNWISFDTDVIGTLPYNTHANFNATLTVPGSVEPGEHTGAIEVSSDQETFDIPVSFVVSTAIFSGTNSDHGNDTDGDGLYDYLTVNVSLNATVQGEYRVEGRLEDENGNYLWTNNSIEITDTNQMVQLYFEGTSIWKNRVNGTYSIYLYLYSRRGDLLDRGSYTTSYYNYTEFQPLPAIFTDIYTDYGEDTDGDGLYDNLAIEIGVVVTDAGRYRVSGKLCECGAMSDWDYVDYDSNTTDLNAGNQTVQLRFYGITLRQNGYDGRYDLRDLCLYNATGSYPYPVPVPEETPTPAIPAPPAPGGSEESVDTKSVTALYEQIDHRDIAYTTSYYDHTDFQRPPAEFTGNCNDYGLDTDNDTLYDYLVIEAEINVTKAGECELDGDLTYYDEEEGYWRWIDGDWNSTYLDTGIQNITLRFDGIRIYQTGYNGSFRTWLNLYETEEWCRIDEMKHSTSDYNYPDFQRPPAEFNDVYTDYGEDTDGDELYDYLTIEIGVDVRKDGYYQVNGQLYERNSYNSIDYGGNTTYLSNGSQTIQLRFEGIKMRQNEYNGTYDLKYLYLYNSSTGTQWDYISNAYTTSYYNYIDFQTIPPCFNYTMEYVTYAWDVIDAPDQIWTGCDDCSYNYVLPWNFTFFCEDHSSIQISTNGLITLPPDASSHCCLPDFENTEAIAPFWGDLSQACGGGTHISVQDKGDRVVVVWYTGTCGGGCLDKDIFEVILYKNGKIRFNYNYLNNIPHSVDAGIGNGIVYYNNIWDDSISVVYSPANIAETISGDLNHDGILIPADAAIALRLAASGGWDANADVNHDDCITPLDALMILQAAADAITL